ncbi:hypothetical protein F4808DRAFT_644 [Astrocystis sublimbata]|nr:hypothetical protein F4808DRAFT_644 [Astrocystis sublimbata]
MKMRAVVQVLEALPAAHAQGLVLVGGHSLLASLIGLSSDQVLEWEVVTATGEHLAATPSHNSDLYWALLGGGGGTYAAVLSVTTKGQLRTLFQCWLSKYLMATPTARALSGTSLVVN